MSDKTIELLDCPFCGGEAKIEDDGFDTPWVFCIACGAHFRGRVDNLPALWNRRTPPSPDTATATDAGPRGELGEELIEVAADVWIYRDTIGRYACWWCNALATQTVDNDGDRVQECKHYDDCLHLRARALEAGNDA